MLRTPKCSRCRNHGFLVPVKGHSGKCRWKQCTCEKCYLITERQKIMAAQKMLKKQAGEEEQEAALCSAGPKLGTAAAAPGPSFHPPLPPPPAAAADVELDPEGRVVTGFPERPPRGPSPGPSAFQPVLGSRSHAGPSEQGTASAIAPMPSPGRLFFGADAAGHGGSGRPPFRGPLAPLPSPPFADFGLPLNINSDSVVGSEYLEREPDKLYPGMNPYRPFPLGYPDATRDSGIPLQRDFRHVSCSYRGGSLVSEPIGDFPPGFYAPPAPPPPLPQQPQFLPPGFLSSLHFLPPPPPPPPPPTPSFSLTILSDADREDREPTDAQETGAEAEVPEDPSQPAAQEKSD